LRNYYLYQWLGVSKLLIKILVYFITGANLAGLGIFGVQSVYARSILSYSSMAQKIAYKFHLNLSDVQAVFNVDRQDRQNQIQVGYRQMLGQAVSQGKLTTAQKQLILDKVQELNSQRQTDLQNRKKMTADQRKAAKEKLQQDLQSWATANNIDIKYLWEPGIRFGMSRVGFHNH
jgi:hypothetical protein